MTGASEFQDSALINLRDMSDSEMGPLNTPSLEAYLRALPGEEGQELSLSGLALYSMLANACQPLVDIQLFRQRLSHKSVKAYATMPIGIMGRKSLALID